jgi:hypothetical protein
MDLKTIYVEGLPLYVQAGLPLHVTPGTSFDQVQRMAHNLGTSLRQTVAKVPTVKVIKTPAGVKPFLARGNSVQLLGEDEESETVVANTEHMTLDGDAREIPVGVHDLWTTPQPPGRASSSPSTPLSAVSFRPAVGRAPADLSCPHRRLVTRKGPKDYPRALPR